MIMKKINFNEVSGIVIFSQMRNLDAYVCDVNLLDGATDINNYDEYMHKEVFDKKDKRKILECYEVEGCLDDSKRFCLFIVDTEYSYSSGVPYKCIDGFLFGSTYNYLYCKKVNKVSKSLMKLDGKKFPLDINTLYGYFNSVHYDLIRHLERCHPEDTKYAISRYNYNLNALDLVLVSTRREYIEYENKEITQKEAIEAVKPFNDLNDAKRKELRDIRSRLNKK